MKRQSLIILLLFVALLITMGFQCGKIYTDPKPAYEFSGELTLTPYKKIYSVNDTITIEFRTADKRMFDHLTNSFISTDTTRLQIGFSYSKLYPAENELELLSDVLSENVVDLLYLNAAPGLNNLSAQTRCTDLNNHFKLSFITKRTGIHSIQPSILVGYCPDKVERSFTRTQFSFDLADCNKDIWLTIPPGSRGGQSGYMNVSFDKKELFVFKVE